MTYSCRGCPDKMDSSNQATLPFLNFAAGVQKERMDLENGL